MSKRAKYPVATRIGLRLPHSKETLKFIEEWDPELYEAILEANNTKPKKKRRRKE